MRDIHFPGRSVVMATQGMVSTSQPMATQAGLDVLKNGGNAMDAAIAASAPEVVISFMDRTNVLTMLATRGLGLPVVVSDQVHRWVHHSVRSSNSAIL